MAKKAPTKETAKSTAQIRQEEIGRLNKLRLRLTTLAKDVKAVKAEESTLAASIMNRLLEKAEVEKGPFSAAVEMVKGDCRPPWKDVHIEHMTEVHGVTAAACEEEVRGEYPPEEGPRLVIGVTEI